MITIFVSYGISRILYLSWSESTIQPYSSWWVGSQNQGECEDKNQHEEEKDSYKGDDDDSDESDESDGSNDDSTDNDTSQPIRVYSRPATNTATFTTKSGSMPDMWDNLALQFGEFYFIFILLFYHFFS